MKFTQTIRQCPDFADQAEKLHFEIKLSLQKIAPAVRPPNKSVMRRLKARKLRVKP